MLPTLFMDMDPVLLLCNGGSANVVVLAVIGGYSIVAVSSSPYRTILLLSAGVASMSSIFASILQEKKDAEGEGDKG